MNNYNIPFENLLRALNKVFSTQTYSKMEKNETNDEIKFSLSEPIKFKADTIGLKHMKPSHSPIEIQIDTIMIFKKSRQKGVKIISYENIRTMNVNVTLITIDTHAQSRKYSGLHFDYHESQTGELQPHPLFHCQMTQNPFEISEFEYGNTMQLDVPRYAHFPMDVILTTSFLLANLAPTIYNQLTQDKGFVAIIRSIQEIYWKPYIINLQGLLLNEDTSDFKKARILNPYWL